MESSGTIRFDSEAAAWDSNATTRLSSELAAKAILEKVDGLEEGGNGTSIIFF